MRLVFKSPAPLTAPPPPLGVDHRAYKLAAYADCWTKLRMWEWEGEFERLVYLDADMLVLKNIDHLFDLPPGFYAAPDCAAGRRTQAERDDCALLRPAGQRPHYFNAGMFAMAPSRAQLAGFHAALATGAARVGSYAEQDLLNHQLKVRRSMIRVRKHCYTILYNSTPACITTRLACCRTRARCRRTSGCRCRRPLTSRKASCGTTPSCGRRSRRQSSTTPTANPGTIPSTRTTPGTLTLWVCGGASTGAGAGGAVLAPLLRC